MMSVSIPNSYFLKNETLMLVVYEKIHPYIEDRPYVARAWKHHVTMQSKVYESNSFNKLVALIQTAHEQLGYYPTSDSVEKMLAEFGTKIIEKLNPLFKKEFPSHDVAISSNKQIVESALEDRAIETSFDVELVGILKNVVSSSKFKEQLAIKSEAIVDFTNAKGEEVVKAKYDNTIEVKPYDEAEQELYEKLVHNAFHRIDEINTDIFDIACFLSMYAPTDEEGFFDFHYNDAALLRNSSLLISSNEERMPEKLKDEVFKYMQRVVALSQIWISVKEGEVIKTNQLDGKQKYKDFSKMFETGRMRIIYDEDDNPLGVYAVQIKPTKLLKTYLAKSKSRGVIDLTALEFHPYKQKYEKRLTRYLSTVWFWNKQKAKTFTIGHIINQLDFSHNFNGVDKYERLLKALNTLKEKGLIKEYSWIDEPLTEKEIGIKGWFEKLKSLRMRIIPSEQTNQRNKNKLKLLEKQKDFDMNAFRRMTTSYDTIDHPVLEHENKHNQILSSLLENFNQEQHPILEKASGPTKERVFHPAPEVKGVKESEDMQLSNITSVKGEDIAIERKRRKLSLRAVAEEIGDVSANTIRRFEKSLTNKQNHHTYMLLLEWYKDSIKKA